MKKVFCLCFLLFMVVCAGSLAFGKTTNDLCEYRYKIVTVENNDTIWGIAKQHCQSDKEIYDFVKQIMKFNKLNSDKIIIGQKIILPLPNDNPN